MNLLLLVLLLMFDDSELDEDDEEELVVDDEDDDDDEEDDDDEHDFLSAPVGSMLVERCFLAAGGFSSNVASLRLSFLNLAGSYRFSLPPGCVRLACTSLTFIT